MRIPRTAFFLLLIALPVAAQESIEIDGTVRASQAYEKKIGHGLVFTVRPDDGGFSIAIEPKVSPSGKLTDADDFTRCVTPPFHGPNPTSVLAWEFVDESNGMLPDTQLAQLKTREFQFVTNYADQKKACNELDAVLYGSGKHGKNGELMFGTPGYKAPPLGHGWFAIRTLELNDLGKGKKARFASLTFKAHLEMPKSTYTPKKTVDPSH